MTNPTDAELDEIEVLVNRWRVHREGDMHNMAGRLIKALRACRAERDRLKAINAELLTALSIVVNKLPPADISATLSAIGTDTPLNLSPDEAKMLRAAIKAQGDQ